MHVAGIIAEYNPLHNGHMHHIEQTRLQTGCDYIVAIVSGDYVQRGEPAIADKFTRTKWALLAGADAVIELPAAFSLSSAERFAYGGVRILSGTGVVNTLSFGSEHTDVVQLETAARELGAETPQFKAALKEQLSLGKAYPRARYDALCALGTNKQTLDILRMPNSILALEYIRMLQRYAPKMQPFVLERKGSRHDSMEPVDAIASASMIRHALLAGNMEALRYTPAFVAREYIAGRRPVSVSNAEQLMLYALRRLSPEDLQLLPDVQEGFENVLFRAAQSSNTLDALFARLKSKRYTMARCKRIALSAMIGYTKAHMTTMHEEDALYIRLLGFRRSARTLVSAIGKNCSLPFIVRKADTLTLSAHAANLLALDTSAHSIYALLQREPLPLDFSQPPVIL
ncbi:nucleotidyltransferase family protein [Christensenellaceae bacterium OttesenSCG-928-L17]|nr:nucleotidyltransferase family protein [Christensenellaceae bacterium OttesenSCG-928-L17]